MKHIYIFFPGHSRARFVKLNPKISNYLKMH